MLRAITRQSSGATSSKLYHVFGTFVEASLDSYFYIKDIKSNTGCLSVSLGHPVSSTQKRMPPTLLPIFSPSDPYRCTLSANSRTELDDSFSEINISKSYIYLNTITEANSLALDDVGFTKKKGDDSRPCALNNLFVCFVCEAVVKRQSCRP